MNFTSGYISLCKNKKVQGLRPKKRFLFGDWLIWNNDTNEITVKGELFAPTKEDLNLCIWLPTGDQLDQYIIEQLDDGSDYTFIYTNFSKEAGHYNAIVYEGGEVKEQITGEINPLICKLKLLISLLEEE